MSTTPTQPPGAPPVGWVKLTDQGSVMSLGMTPSRVRVNGYPVATKRGENLIPVWAGRNHLDVDVTWMWTYGQAAIDVDVPPNQTVAVWYAPPYTTMSRGAIGTTPQKRPDRWIYWVVLAIVILAMLVGFVALNVLD